MTVADAMIIASKVSALQSLDINIEKLESMAAEQFVFDMNIQTYTKGGDKLSTITLSANHLNTLREALIVQRRELVESLSGWRYFGIIEDRSEDK